MTLVYQVPARRPSPLGTYLDGGGDISGSTPELARAMTILILAQQAWEDRHATHTPDPDFDTPSWCIHQGARWDCLALHADYHQYLQLADPAGPDADQHARLANTYAALGIEQAQKIQAVADRRRDRRVMAAVWTIALAVVATTTALLTVWGAFR